MSDRVLPWESLAGLTGSADRCTCGDDQLNLVGCDCRAQQNLPVRCSNPACDAFLRSNEEIFVGVCPSHKGDLEHQLGFVPGRPIPEELPDDGYYDDHGQNHAEWVGPEFADEVSLEERWEHYAFEERNGMPYGSSF